MDEPLVINASPLILLSRIGGLDWLAGLSCDLRVPAAVLWELEEGRTRDDCAVQVRGRANLRVVADLALSPAVVAWQLGPGESQVIAHALASPPARTLLDDRAARRAARSFGCRVIGTLGAVALLAHRGVIRDLPETVDRLRAAGLRISQPVVDRILADALGRGEPPR